MGLSWLPLQLVLGALLGVVGPMWIEKMAQQNRYAALLILGKSVGQTGFRKSRSDQ
jgi:hypothetical protein